MSTKKKSSISKTKPVKKKPSKRVKKEYLEKDDLIIFTDGACSGNGKAYAKGGYGVYFPYNEYPDVSEPFLIKPITNQRAELYAILTALKMIEHDTDKYENIKIYSDSQYSINCLTNWINNWKKNNWMTSNGKPVMNREFIIPASEIIDKSGNIIFEHIRSHTKKDDFFSIGNAMVDQLATAGVLKTADAKKQIIIEVDKKLKKKKT